MKLVLKKVNFESMLLQDLEELNFYVKNCISFIRTRGEKDWDTVDNLKRAVRKLETTY